MARDVGLRERKKRQSRQVIIEAAFLLFTERGFDRVTVAEVARAANVAEGTVFNYFPTKELLVFHGMEAFEEALLDAVRTRPAGETVLAAFGRLLLGGSGRRGPDDAGEVAAAAAQVIAGSPTLRARQREIVSAYTRALAALLANETGADPDDIEPQVVAHALMGVHEALVEAMQRRGLDGRPRTGLATEVRTQAERALARLDRGLGGYAPRPDPAPRRAESRE